MAATRRQDGHQHGHGRLGKNRPNDSKAGKAARRLSERVCRDGSRLPNAGEIVQEHFGEIFTPTPRPQNVAGWRARLFPSCNSLFVAILQRPASPPTVAGSLALADSFFARCLLQRPSGPSRAGKLKRKKTRVFPVGQNSARREGVRLLGASCGSRDAGLYGGASDESMAYVECERAGSPGLPCACLPRLFMYNPVAGGPSLYSR
jgi:hypothetical protein